MKPYHLAAALCACCLPLGVQAAPLVSTQALAGQLLLPPDRATVSDTSPDGAAPVFSSVQTPALQAFDAGQGVLVGVRGSLQVDADHGLMAYRNESGGSWTSQARVRSTWQLGATVLATSTLAQAASDRDTPVVINTTWSALGFDALAAALDAFVGSGALGSTLNTGISAFINGGGGGSTAIASVLTAAGAIDPNGLTAGLALHYHYLANAQMSFSAAGAASTGSMQLGSAPATFALFALGDATATTGAALDGIACSGGCGAFALEFAPLAGLQAGGRADGNVRALGTTAASATYRFSFTDDAGTGSAASRRGHELTLQVSAVPEPATTALWLGGIGLLLAKRRRHSARS